MVASGDQVVLLGAPEIGISQRLDQLVDEGSVQLARLGTIDDPRPASTERSIPTVIDDFFEVVASYVEERDRRDAIREAVQECRDEGRTFVRTTPYRFEWLLSHHRDAVEALIGDPTEWTVKTVGCDLDDAREQVAEWDYPATDEQLRATAWPDEPYDLKAALGPHYRGDAGELLAVDSYQTLVPEMLRGAGDPDVALDRRQKVGRTLAAMLDDLTTASAIEATTDQDKGVLDMISDVGETLLERDVDPVVDTLDLDAGLVGGAAGAASGALGGAPLAVGTIGLWAYLKHRQRGRDREIVHDEFRVLFDASRPTTTAARRESIERERSLPPTALNALDQTTREIGDRDLDSLADDLDKTLDTIGLVLDRHADILDRIEAAVEDARPTFMPLEDFRDEQYELPDYVPPEIEDGRSAPEVLIDHLEEDRTSITFLVGESGIGKSRLTIEVGDRLPDDVDIWYIRDPPDVRPPPVSADRVVLVLDEAGTWERSRAFLDQAIAHRRNWDCETLHIVATLRPIYEQSLDAEVPDHVPQQTIEVPSLSESGTKRLLGDVDIDEETVTGIHQTTDGNPFLARLLALAEEGHDGETTPDEKIEEVIVRKFLEEPADEWAAPTAVKTLLEIIAIVGRFDTDTGDLVDGVSHFDLPDNYGAVLSTLADTKYIEKHPGDTFEDPTYSHRIDVFAEYLRWRVLNRNPAQYAKLVNASLDTNPGDLARGVVTLRESALARFDFFDEDAIEEDTRTLLTEHIAPGLSDSNGSLAAVIDAAFWVSFAVPDNFDHRPILNRFEATDIGSSSAEEVARQLYNIVNLSYRLGLDEGDGNSVGARWLNRLEGIAEDHEGSEEIQLALAKGLNVAIGVGEIECLERLYSVARDHEDDEKIQLRLAWGLANAINAGETEYLEQLETVAEDHEDNEEIQRALATGFSNAVSEGEMWHMDRLETVAETYANDEEIQIRFAQALYNAILAEQMEHLHRLARLADDFEIEEIQVELASALVSAINAGETKHLDQLEILAEKYEDSEEVQLRFAMGLANAIKAGETGHLDRLKTIAGNHENNEEMQLALAIGLVNTISAGETKHLERLKTAADNHENSKRIQARLAGGLLNAIDAGETEHLERLETVATNNPDHDEIRTVALAGHLLALHRYFEPNDSATVEALAGLDNIGTAGSQFTLTEKTTIITEAAVAIAEAFIRSEALAKFERYVTALEAMLTPARWTAIGGRIVTAVTDLEREGRISTAVLAQVNDILADLD